MQIRPGNAGKRVWVRKARLLFRDADALELERGVNALRVDKAVLVRVKVLEEAVEGVLEVFWRHMPRAVVDLRAPPQIQACNASAVSRQAAACSVSTGAA